MSFYTGYEYFDLHLSSIMKQRSNLAKESFMHGLYVIDLRQAINSQINREIKHYALFKDRIQKTKKSIRDIKNKMAKKNKYIVKRKLKLLIGDGAIVLAKICAAIIHEKKRKILQQSLENKERILKQYEFPRSRWQPNFGERIRCSLVKEDVLREGMNYLENEYKDRILKLREKFHTEKGNCKSCGCDDNVVKIECGDTYHIECINDLIISQIVENKLDHASCIGCGKLLQF